VVVSHQPSDVQAAPGIPRCAVLPLQGRF